MNRLEYMQRLNELLMDISSDDRKDALQYYEDYFEDAGASNEEQVIRELGAPEQVAGGIKEGLFGNANSPEGSYTERGYADPDEQTIRYAVAERAGRTASKAEEKQEAGERPEDIIIDQEARTGQADG